MFLLVPHPKTFVNFLFIHLTFMHTTRVSRADNLFVQKSRLHMKLKSFPAFGTRLWNCLHPDWRKLTKRTFKRKIHKLLLTVLEIEYYYVDARSLILNLNTRTELNWIELISFSVSVVSSHQCRQLLVVIPLVYHWFLVIVVNFSFSSSVYRRPLVIFSCTVLKLSCTYSL